MLNELGPSHRVMEGDGVYNKHAKPPADGTWLPTISQNHSAGLEN